MSRLPRVAFYALRDFHVPILLPVLRALHERGAWNAGVVAPPFVESSHDRVQEGLSPSTLQALADAGVPFWGHDRQGEYACVVTADACYDRVDGWGPVVCIGHGTISKGLYFTDAPSARRENFARVLCVPGPAYVDAFGGQVFTRVVPTGFSKMDELSALPPDHRCTVLSRLGLDPDRRTLLFAPTFNPELTALRILEDAWARLDAHRDQVLFKLHGATDAAWVARYRALAERLPHARFVEDASLAGWMVASDIVISDVSSASVEALALSRPVVVVDSPLMPTYPLYRPTDIEYRVRRAAYRVRTSADLLETLERLRTADPLDAQRRRWARRLFAPLDGRNSERIATEIAAVASGAIEQQLPRDGAKLSVYVPDDVVDEARVAANLARAVAPGRVYRGAERPPQPFICLTGEFDLPHGWDLLWWMASHFNAPSPTRPLAGIFGPMLPDRSDLGAQRRSACFPQSPALADRARQTLFKHHAFDQIAAAATLCADGSIVSKGVPREIAEAWIDHVADAEGRARVAQRVLQGGMHVGVLAGTYGTQTSEAAAGAPDVLFYCFKNVHLAVFEPVVAAVRRRWPAARIAFAAPPPSAAARQGLALEERDRFAARTGADWVSDPSSVRPGVTVIADGVAAHLRGHRRIVNVGHGLISKGQYYGANAFVGRENLADAVCVPGPWHAEQLRPHVYVPIHVTGMAKLDRLFTPFDERAFRRARRLPAEGPILLWCPTFNPELSSLPVIGAEIRRLTAFGTVVIKLHASTDPADAGWLAAAVADEPRIHLVDRSEDATPFMRCASLLVTDVSSVMFEFAALDRPIVLVDNPRQTRYANFRETDVEYAMRDVGPRVTTAGELVEAVRRELEEPDRHREARRRATAAMFAATDGRSADRIAAIICDEPAAAPWRGPFDVVLPESFSAADLEAAAGSLRGAASVVGPGTAAAAAAGLPYRGYATAAERKALVASGASANVLVLRRPARLIGDWRAPLFGPLYLPESAPAMTAPLTTNDPEAPSYVFRFIKPDRVQLPARVSPELLADVIRITNPGERAEAAGVDPAVIAARRGGARTGSARPVLVLDALSVA